MSEVFRMSNRARINYLMVRAEGKRYPRGCGGKSLGLIAHTVTDWGSEDAYGLLRELKVVRSK